MIIIIIITIIIIIIITIIIACNWVVTRWQWLFYIYTIILIIIIIINVKDWTLWSVPSPELQLLAPTLLRSSNCSSSLLPQGLLSMPTDNSHKSLETPSDRTSVGCASKSHFLTSSIVISGQCNFSCSRQERMEASPRRLETETFG